MVGGVVSVCVPMVMSLRVCVCVCVHIPACGGGYEWDA